MAFFKEKPLIFFIFIFAALGGLLYGYDLGVISGALLFIDKDITLTTNQTALVVSAVLGGGSIATLISGPLADWIGRKKMLIIAAVILIIGTLIIAISYNFSTLLTGRLVQGIGVGIITIIIPLYLTESAPKDMRGRAIAIFQLVLTFGILLAYLVNVIFAKDENWRAMFLCVLIFALIFLIGTIFIPESPIWLFSKNKHLKAKNILLKLRKANDAQIEYEELLALQKKLKPSIEKIKWQKHYFIPLVIALGIGILNQLTGINVILQYITVILKDAGLNLNWMSLLGSVGVGFINFVTTIIAFSLIDKIGRRKLLLGGTIGIIFFLSISAFASFFLTFSYLKGIIILSSMIGYICSFAIGPGVIVWLAISEVLPNAIRSKGMGVALFLNSFASTVYASTFLQLVEKIDYFGLFFLSAFFTSIYLILTYYLLPETKNKTLEEIEEHFQKKYE
jgi:sugar porter (SP) family MFS transporter